MFFIFWTATVVTTCKPSDNKPMPEDNGWSLSRWLLTGSGFVKRE